ncbi:MAG: acyltransferase family protein [Polymorphobacter sp.]
MSLFLGPGSLRLVLAILVFVSHVSRFNVGTPAVILFFMLSGYWVTQLYLRRRGTVAAYMLDRWLRIWPMLALAAVGTVLAKQFFDLPPWGSLLRTLTLMGITTTRGDVIGVSWSLDIEMQFYLLLPLGLWLYGRVDRYRGAAALAGVLAVTLLGLWLSRNGIRTVLDYAPAFAVGAALQLTRWLPSGRLALASLLLFFGLAIVLTILPATAYLFIKQAQPWYGNTASLFLCLLLTPYIAWNVRQPSPPLDRTLGNFSYPFYLVHYPLLVVGLSVGWFDGSYTGKLVAFVATMVLTIALYYAFDRPVERWRVALRDRGARTG